MTEVTNAELADALLSLAVESRNSDAIILRLAAARLREAPSVSNSAGWIEWGGGECPVEPVMFVDVALRSGETDSGRAEEYFWWHAGDSVDIVRYRLCE